MKTGTVTFLLFVGLGPGPWVTAGAARAAPAGAQESPEARPDPRVLGFDAAALVAHFTPEVAASAKLRARALALWETHFAAHAAEIERRFTSEADWRPAYADAAALVEAFLEASELPRARSWPGPEGQIWVEALDPRTERRTRTLVRPAPAEQARRQRLLAPETESGEEALPKAEPAGAPARGARRR